MKTLPILSQKEDLTLLRKNLYFTLDTEAKKEKKFGSSEQI